jgi:catechol 2,3-dioxygenase
MTPVIQHETEAQTPCGLNHLVLNVGDIEESHRFWTDLLGFHQVGASHRPDPDGKRRGSKFAILGLHERAETAGL